MEQERERPAEGIESKAPESSRELPKLEEIACGGCGRSFFTTDGPGMLEAIKGNCPDCGGTFKLVTKRAAG